MGLLKKIFNGTLKKVVVKIGVSASAVTWPLAVIEMYEKYNTAKDFYNSNYYPASSEARKWADITALLEASQGLGEKVEGYDKDRSSDEYTIMKKELEKNLDKASYKVCCTRYDKREELSQKIDLLYDSVDKERFSQEFNSGFNAAIIEARENLAYVRDSIKDLKIAKMDKKLV